MLYLLALTFSYLTHFELDFVCGMNWGPNPFFCMWLTSCPSTMCWNDYFFSFEWSWEPCWKQTDHNCRGLSLGCHFYSLIHMFNLMLCCAYLLSCVWLFATPWTVDHQGSPVHEILQAGILEWVATLFSRGSSPPRDQKQVSCILGSTLDGVFACVCVCAFPSLHSSPSGL